MSRDRKWGTKEERKYQKKRRWGLWWLETPYRKAFFCLGLFFFKPSFPQNFPRRQLQTDLWFLSILSRSEEMQMNREGKVALIVWRSGPLGKQCQTSMKQKLLLKIQERVRKGRDTECRGGAARKEIWEAGIRTWRGKWCQKRKEGKNDGTDEGDRRTRMGTNRGKEGGTKE